MCAMSPPSRWRRWSEVEGWTSWQRSEDYYTEGMLIWLDVDTKIRELSGDKRSLLAFVAASISGNAAQG